MPKKKPPPAPLTLPTKASFFSPKREFSDVPKAEVAAPPAIAPMRQRLLYDKETGLPSAEVINNAAVCLATGEELFRFKDRKEEGFNDFQPAFAARFDFAPPGGKKHPGERSVDVLELVKAGILSNDDVASRKAFSEEQLQEMAQRLSEYQIERETLCSFRME